VTFCDGRALADVFDLGAGGGPEGLLCVDRTPESLHYAQVVPPRGEPRCYRHQRLWAKHASANGTRRHRGQPEQDYTPEVTPEDSGYLLLDHDNLTDLELIFDRGSGYREQMRRHAPDTDAYREAAAGLADFWEQIVEYFHDGLRLDELLDKRLPPAH